MCIVVAGSCSGDRQPSSGTGPEPSSLSVSVSESAAGQLAGLDVVASFYPLQFVVEQIGGSVVRVTNLTAAGAEPHDLELTPTATAQLEDADLVVLLGGLAPALDDAISDNGGIGDDHVLDVSANAQLDLLVDGSDGRSDPHFWLDPQRLADVGDRVAARLSEIEPAGAATFDANATTLRSRLTALDGEFAQGLASCSNTAIVTSHAAFGYLAARYGLRQVAISGLSPDEEPSPADVADVAQFVAANDVRTIYYETLVDPDVAETLAAETGASTAVLDPLEGLSEGSAGADYFDVMRSNLQTLRAGQGCT